MQNTFTILPVEDVKIIKQINIVSRNQLNIEITIGFILYERNFTSDYRFVEVDEKEKDLIYFTTYPKQEDYPSDEIDDLLLKTIQNNYSNSFIRNELQFTTSDIEQLKNKINRPFEKSDLIIRPDFSGQQIEQLAGKTFSAFGQKVNIYVDGSSDLIKNIHFYGLCDFATQEIIYSQLDKIKFL